MAGVAGYAPHAGEQRWRVNPVRDAATVAPVSQTATFGFPSWPLRHSENGAMPIVACAINEMLLQIYDPSLRICPAVPGTWDVRLDLAAGDRPGEIAPVEEQAGVNPERSAPSLQAGGLEP